MRLLLFSEARAYEWCTLRRHVESPVSMSSLIDGHGKGSSDDVIKGSKRVLFLLSNVNAYEWHD